LEVRGLVARGGLRVSAEVAAPQFPFKAKESGDCDGGAMAYF